MQHGISFLRSMRRGSLSTAALLVLGLCGILGDRAVLAVLRDEDRVSGTAPVGYYEALLHKPGDAISATAAGPPPGWLPFGGEETGIVRELDSYLRWNLNPNLDLRWNGTVFRTNSLGYRSPEIRPEKPEGTYRILVFGSSNTMGYGVDNDEIYTHLLEGWLNGRGDGSRRVEVVNLAVSGDSPSRRLYRMQREAGRLDPDWILCDVSFFDAWLEDRHIQSALERKLPIPFPFVEEAIRRTGVTGWVTFSAFSDQFRGESEGLFGEVYAGWKAEARRLGVPLTLVILPRADSKEKSPRLRRVIHGLAGSNGLDVVDVADAFERLDLEEFRISEWDKHPNAYGHRVIFEAIRDELIRRGRLPD